MLENFRWMDNTADAYILGTTLQESDIRQTGSEAVIYCSLVGGLTLR